MTTSDENIDIKKEKKQDVLVLRLNGKLDAMNSVEIEKQISHIIDGGEKKLLLDFHHVDYVSSAGMRMLLMVAKKLRRVSGKLVLCTMNSRVMEVLKMSGFDHLMDLESNETEALIKFR
jgi:anti-anti-sigma factor